MSDLNIKVNNDVKYESLYFTYLLFLILLAFVFRVAVKFILLLIGLSFGTKSKKNGNIPNWSDYRKAKQENLKLKNPLRKALSLCRNTLKQKHWRICEKSRDEMFEIESKKLCFLLITVLNLSFLILYLNPIDLQENNLVDLLYDEETEQNR